MKANNLIFAMFLSWITNNGYANVDTLRDPKRQISFGVSGAYFNKTRDWSFYENNFPGNKRSLNFALDYRKKLNDEYYLGFHYDYFRTGLKNEMNDKFGKRFQSSFFHSVGLSLYRGFRKEFNNDLSLESMLGAGVVSRIGSERYTVVDLGQNEILSPVGLNAGIGEYLLYKDFIFVGIDFELNAYYPIKGINFSENYNFFISNTISLGMRF